MTGGNFECIINFHYLDKKWFSHTNGGYAEAIINSNNINITKLYGINNTNNQALIHINTDISMSS